MLHKEGYIIDKWGKKRQAKWFVCKYCKKEYLKRIYKDRPNEFCSIACFHKSQITQIELVCDWCKKTFFRRKSHLNNSKTGLHFCSRFCKERAQEIGGLPELKLPRYSNGEKRNTYSRDKAFKHLEPVCSECGYKDDISMLDVDHKDGNSGNSKIENLQFLCVWCHALKTRKIFKHNWNGSLA